MKAAWFDRYGPPEVVRVEEVPTPRPKEDEILVKVVASAVTVGDARIRAARFPRGFSPIGRLVFGVRRPRRRVLGSSFSGVVDAVGAKVTQFRPGDEVCGMSGARLGAHAEYVAVRADRAVVAKPGSVGPDDAAAVLFGATTALYFLRDRAGVVEGQHVLVNGASGAVGTNAVQLANHLGAHVTAVTSTPNAALIRDLGAGQVVDYRQERLLDRSDRYDVVVDAVGNLTIRDGRRLLTPEGTLVMVVADLYQLLRPGKHLVSGTAPERAEDVAFLLGLVEGGALRVVIDGTYALDRVVDAHRRVDSGHKVGNVVLHPGPDASHDAP